jgi:hypothetical protein
MRYLGGIILGLLLAHTAGTSETRVVRTEFCELLRSPEQYNGKEVTVRATHQYGFEWSTLYCLNCLDKGKAWLDFSEDIDDFSEAALKSAPKDAGIVNLTVKGTFMSGSTYGHLNGYRYRFVARKVWGVATLVKGMKKPDKEKTIQAKWACGGMNPK